MNRSLKTLAGAGLVAIIVLTGSAAQAAPRVSEASSADVTASQEVSLRSGPLTRGNKVTVSSDTKDGVRLTGVRLTNTKDGVRLTNDKDGVRLTGVRLTGTKDGVRLTTKTDGVRLTNDKDGVRLTGVRLT